MLLMFLNISGTEFVFLVVLALVVIGPKRMPEYAQKLRDLVRLVRDKAKDARRSVEEDFGDDFKDVDWRKLDPRQYDPRRIVREALQDDEDESPSESDGPLAPSPIQRYQEQAKLRVPSEPAPYDSEAT